MLFYELYVFYYDVLPVLYDVMVYDDSVLYGFCCSSYIRMESICLLLLMTWTGYLEKAARGRSCCCWWWLRLLLWNFWWNLKRRNGVQRACAIVNNYGGMEGSIDIIDCVLFSIFLWKKWWLWLLCDYSGELLFWLKEWLWKGVDDLMACVEGGWWWWWQWPSLLEKLLIQTLFSDYTTDLLAEEKCGRYEDDDDILLWNHRCILFEGSTVVIEEEVPLESILVFWGKLLFKLMMKKSGRVLLKEIILIPFCSLLMMMILVLAVTEGDIDAMIFGGREMMIVHCWWWPVWYSVVFDLTFVDWCTVLCRMRWWWCYSVLFIIQYYSVDDVLPTTAATIENIIDYSSDVKTLIRRNCCNCVTWNLMMKSQLNYDEEEMIWMKGSWAWRYLLYVAKTAFNWRGWRGRWESDVLLILILWWKVWYASDDDDILRLFIQYSDDYLAGSYDGSWRNVMIKYSTLPVMWWLLLRKDLLTIFGILADVCDQRRQPGERSIEIEVKRVTVADGDEYRAGYSWLYWWWYRWPMTKFMCLKRNDGGKINVKTYSIQYYSMLLILAELKWEEEW